MIASKSKLSEVEIYFDPMIVLRNIRDEQLDILHTQLSAISNGIRICNYYGSAFSSYKERMTSVENVIVNLDFNGRKLIVGDFNSYDKLINTIPLIYHNL